MKEPKQPPAAKLPSHGLPEWGRDLPPDVSLPSCTSHTHSGVMYNHALSVQFLDRLEMFSDESARKQMELTERIKQEVCE